MFDNNYNYIIEFKIDDIDLTDNLFEIQIQENRPMSYPIIKVRLHGDSEEIQLMKNLPYHKDYKLNITLLSIIDEKPIEEYSFNLVEVKRDITFRQPDQKRPDYIEQFDNTFIELKFMLREHIDILNKRITKTFRLNTIKEIQNYLQSKQNTSIKWLDEPIDQTIYQFLVADQTIISQLRSLEYHYGIYNDDLFYLFRLVEPTKLEIQKMSNMINTKKIKRINFLQSITENHNKIVSLDEYFTLDQANIGSENNTFFINNYNKLKVNYKSLYEFNKTEEYELSNYVKNNKTSSQYNDGIWNYTSHELLLEKSYNHTDGIFGNYLKDEYNENISPQMENFIQKQLSNLNVSTIEIPHRFKIGDLEIGNVIELYSENPDYLKLTGKYIIDRSTMVFSKQEAQRPNDWLAFQNLGIARQNYFAQE